MAMTPPLSTQFTHVLLVMESVPVGADGVALTVIVTVLLILVHITPLVVV
jgi:hypothetical protein